jgi:excisionase family DNA binding protein
MLWSVEEEDTYSVSEAAKILQLTEGRIRQMLRAGDLEGAPPDQSHGRGWRIPMRAVHAILEERRGRADAVAELSAEAQGTALGEAAELRARVETLQRELGRLEGHLELTERTESTIREQLQRERERADEAELEARRLRAALEEARKPEPPWWQRMYGG